ncbi:MAG: type IV pilus twitching motility protein PilT, partial [Actinomycetes bacterium]
METSGYQPVPNEPGGFAPAPVPTPEPDAPANEGWTYSYAVESAPADAPPVEAVEAAEATATETWGSDPLGASWAPTEEAAPASAYVPELLVPAATPLAAPTPFAPEVVALSESDTSVLVADSEAEEAAYSRGSTEAPSDEDDLNLNDMLILVLDRGASDLHLTSGARPAIRLNGELVQLSDEYPILTPPVIQRVMYAALTQKQREKFEENLELDFAYSVPGRARFRVNIYRQRDALGAAFRIIPFEIKKLEDLGVPPSVANFASLARGFVLVTGPTGSGKSTTLAALVDLANRTRAEHIMTVEDPIEFLHRHQKCIVNQREVGEDTWSFQNALKHVLRQDPDIILVGEMRDLETISVALTAAET